MIGPINASYVCLCVAVIVMAAAQISSPAGKAALVLAVLAVVLLGVRL
jgi:hypothetical protein